MSVKNMATLMFACSQIKNICCWDFGTVLTLLTAWKNVCDFFSMNHGGVFFLPCKKSSLR